MARSRRITAKSYVPPETVSTEQLAPLMAALLGGPAGLFVVNTPNEGQIDNLPRDAMVECMAHVDGLGVRPLAVGPLPPAVHAVVAAHVDRQELIVEAALTGRYELARAALASDPLIRDPQTVGPMFDELVAANARSRETTEAKIAALDQERLDVEIAAVSAQPAPDVLPTKKDGFSIASSTIQQLLDDDAARAILETHFVEVLDHPQLQLASGLTLEAIAVYAPQILTPEKLRRVEVELARLKVGQTKQ